MTTVLGHWEEIYQSNIRSYRWEYFLLTCDPCAVLYTTKDISHNIRADHILYESSNVIAEIYYQNENC